VGVSAAYARNGCTGSINAWQPPFFSALLEGRLEEEEGLEGGGGRTGGGKEK